MKRLNCPNTSVVRTLRYTLAASVLALAMGVSAGEGSAVTMYSNSISAAATTAQASSIELRVAGPDGFRASERSETGALDWYPGGLADGEYRYEVFVTVGDQPEEGAADTTRLYRENGRFKVENGTIAPLEEADLPPPPNVDDQAGAESAPWYEKLATGVLDFLVPPAAAASLITNPGDVFITDPSPYIFWNDTDVAGYDWYTLGLSSGFGIYDVTNSHYLLYGAKNSAFGIYDYSTYLQFYNWSASGASIYLDENSGVDVLRADANGDIELADGSVFIDKSANYLGVGTMTPTDDIHVYSATPALLLDDTAGGDIRIRNSGGELSFYRSSGIQNGEVLTLENNLSASLYPGVGVWNPNPTVPLHVRSHDNRSAKLLVENTLAPTAAGDVTMFNLKNAGNKIVRFAIQAGGSNSIWTFDNDPNYNAAAGINGGRFRVSKSGSGAVEFSVDGYGHGRFNGNSYAVIHINTSSREAKTDFVALNEQDVLDRLMQLPVSQWRYKQEREGSRHIGPVAEDFRQAFGLGDGKHIATVDSEGIALAAIKAVKSEKDAEIAALRAEKEAEIASLTAERDAKIAALSERLRALEELLVGQQQVSAR